METYTYDIALSLLMRNRLRTALQLLDKFGTAAEAWKQLNEPRMQECWQRAEQETQWIKSYQIRVWTLADKDYPYRLRQCPDRPLVLYGRGNIDLSTGHFVSIVGTRRPSERGKELTKRLVEDLHDRLEKVTVISGGAYGIDIAAHRAALECGASTIIVPAHGLDRIYPSMHRPEAIAALQNGGLLTEYTSGTEPVALNFVCRNRIVAGLADAVVVVESPNKGGSLITASMACDYNRDLFAFPGRPQDDNSAGCNTLIRRQQAHLITCADNLIEAMGWTTQAETKQPVQTRMVELMGDLTDRQQRIVRKLQETEDGMHINLIVMETELSYSDVSADLVLLEIEGLVKSLPGGIYRLVN